MVIGGQGDQHRATGRGRHRARATEAGGVEGGQTSNVGTRSYTPPSVIRAAEMLFTATEAGEVGGGQGSNVGTRSYTPPSVIRAPEVLFTLAGQSQCFFCCNEKGMAQHCSQHTCPSKVVCAKHYHRASCFGFQFFTRSNKKLSRIAKSSGKHPLVQHRS